MSPKRILIVIPAYNEEQTIAGVILGIRNQVNWDILVVDDNSTDSTTYEASNVNAMIISLPTHCGAWRAIQTGIRYARAEQYDIVVSMDADGQHSPMSLQKLVNPIVNENYDVSIGVCVERATYIRKLTWKFFQKMSGLSLEDITSGYRAYSASSMDVLLLDEATMLAFQDVGVLMLLSKANQKVTEIEVIMFERAVGISRIYSSWIAIWVYLTQTLLLCVSKLSNPWNQSHK